MIRVLVGLWWGEGMEKCGRNHEPGKSRKKWWKRKQHTPRDTNSEILFEVSYSVRTEARERRVCVWLRVCLCVCVPMCVYVCKHRVCVCVCWPEPRFEWVGSKTKQASKKVKQPSSPHTHTHKEKEWLHVRKQCLVRKESRTYLYVNTRCMRLAFPHLDPPTTTTPGGGRVVVLIQ